jgi:hypothetical protein
MTAARLALATALFLTVLATPADAATRYVRDSSYVDHRGVRICLYIKQVKTWRTLWLWDSRGYHLRRCR